MRIDEFVNDTKRRLESHREQAGLRECALETGVSASTLSRFLRGKNIDLETFMKISRAIDALWDQPE